MLFTFCPKCGGKLAKKSRYLLACKICGFDFYINPKPVVNLILENEKGEILLAKRKFPPSKGMWNLPGGFLDPGESFEKALAREIKEELQLILNKPHYFSSYKERYHFQQVNHHILNVIFTDKQQSPIITVGDDTSEAVFFMPSDIPYKQMNAPSERQAIKEYFARKYINSK